MVMVEVTWRSRRSLGLLVVLALAAGAGVTWWLTRPDPQDGERVSGPHGAYPAALGTGAPAAPDHFVRKVDNAVAVDGGLSFHETDENDDGSPEGLTARSLRTGTTYWHYKRGGNVIRAVRVVDGTAVLRYDDGTLIAIDARSAEQRWQQDLPKKSRFGDRLWTANGVVATYAGDELIAVDLTTGKRAWTADVPESCDLGDVVFILGTAFGVEATCGSGPRPEDVVLGIDARRGTVRWRHPDWMGGLRYLPLTDHTVYAPHWNNTDRGAVIDVSGTKPVIHTAPDPDLAWDGQNRTTVLTTFGKEGERWKENNVLRARGTDDGRVQWTRHAPKDRRFGRALVADGRVYVVEQPQESRQRAPERGPARLLALDLTSGKPLHTAPIPVPDREDSEDSLDVRAVRDGIVAVGWQGVPGDAADSLTIVSD
ncbi:PQQ-binding-like beta-propeller repeat protein [Streptomyces luomodiensis]|uniref:PQQ-binding-like beta-propeller repeat protein n=1 Tax=Streptomyces luomodiensis TaxID=3026192 RepID=A0ABY9V8L3_9ACTN|nr:PQQ-binding-like beta-propeller repeat protein [Streptomyces sp. SCA4-21]WNE99055.1 PQQ-binding-like beta-propeller repeat protein [Streptomyces sp. SCA4-21]